MPEEEDSDKLRKKFKKYLEYIFKDLCIKHNAKGVSAYALLKVSTCSNVVKFQ